MLLTVLPAKYRRLWSFIATDGVIPVIEAATPRRMTRILRDAQLLESGHVTAVSIVQVGGQLRSAARLALKFSQPVPAHVPQRVYLKLVTPGLIRGRGHDRALREWEFYTSVTTALTPSLLSMGVVRCLDAAAEADGAAHLVLQDVSETHTQPEWPIPPTQAEVERAVDWAAGFHRTWWEQPRLHDLRRPKTSPEGLAAVAERHLTAISQQLSSVERCRTRRVYDVIAGLWERGTLGAPPRRAYTLTHGDLHFWNLLYPQASTDSIAVIDWEDWKVGHAMTEMAYLIGLHWDRSRDAAEEVALIKRYHSVLTATGSVLYSWDDCWRDYRFGMIAMFTVPAVFWDRQLMASVWWPHLKRIHAAYAQLECDELLADLR